MSEILSPIARPELFIGIAGPIGVDMDAIVQCLNEALMRVGYRPAPIRLTEEMVAIPTGLPILTGDFYAEADSKMKYGNAIRSMSGDAAALASVAVMAIRSARRTATGDAGVAPNSVAFVIRQLKRPEEVEFLRRLYGKQFILISAYGSREQRRALIQERLRQTMATTTRLGELNAKAEDLIETDFGAWEGKTFLEAAQHDPDLHGRWLRDTTLRPPGS